VGLGRYSVSAAPPLRVMDPLGREQDAGCAVVFEIPEGCSCVRDTVPMGDLVPPDPPLAGVQTVLRPFRVGDAAAVAKSAGIPTYPVHDDAGGDD